MPPTTPIIDPRGFQDLVDEAKRRIPQYCPEWTDHNVSDPGVTLIELFAWMSDIILYRLNKVPERDYLTFLELIGARPHPAVPASTELTFWLTAPQSETKLIPRGSEIATRQTETRPAVSFTTDSDLRIRVPLLKYCVAARRQAETAAVPYVYDDFSERRGWSDANIAVFQKNPQDGDAFYLGFEENLGGHVIRLNLRCGHVEAPNISQEDPPLVWEFWNGDSWANLQPPPEELELLCQVEPECQELGPRLDETRGLDRNGRVLLVVPRTCAMSLLPVGDRAVEACWFRCRARKRRPDERFYALSPILQGFTAASLGGMIVASQSNEIPREVIGRSDGTPAQAFRLLYPPVLPRRVEGPAAETVEIQRADGTFERWTEVEHFADSSPTDSHFVVDELTGEVRFGPRLREPQGEERQYGRVPPKGMLIHFTRYRSGGGTVGNVGRGTLVVPKSASELVYVKWISNLRPATGGRDRESLDAFKLRGPKLVQTREVAVTRADFEYLAQEATPQAARVRCLSAATDPKANGAGPRHVRLLIVPAVPTTDELVPRVQLVLSPEVRRELVRKVRAYLEDRCPVTTELAVGLADYRWVTVQAHLVVRARPDFEKVDRDASRARIQEDARRLLYRFIQPVTGGPERQGWPFGKSLTLGDVYPLLQSIPGVEYVESVRFRPVTYAADGARLVGGEERLIRLAETEVLCSDVHEIVVDEE
jgi:predicted phage baseplate assembly protein